MRSSKGGYPAWKCRLCGAVFTDKKAEAFTLPNGYPMQAQGIQLYRQGGFSQAVTLNKHICADGSLGIADFIGLKNRLEEAISEEKEVK